MNKLLSLVAFHGALALLAADAAPALVSTVAQPGRSAAAGSFLPEFSADGRHLVFVSQADNLVTNDAPSSALNVYMRDLVASNTMLISVASSGWGGAHADANSPAVSSNGQFVAFASRANNLTHADHNNAQDIFVRDCVAGTTVLASVAADGSSPSDPGRGRNIPLSDYPLISADGRFVFFESRATDLVPASVAPAAVQVYRRDLLSNATSIATADAAGLPATGPVKMLGISKSGRFAAFSATNGLSPEATNGASEVFVRDFTSGELLAASAGVNTLTNLGAYGCDSAVLDEMSVWFVAASPAGGGLFRFDFQGKQLQLVTGTAPNSSIIAVSDDRQYILYQDAIRGGMRVDANTGSAMDLGAPPCGCPGLSGTNCAYLPQMSFDGKRLVFLTPSACDHATIIWRDIDADTTKIVATTAIHEAPSLSPSGLLIGFASPSSQIVPPDKNVATDVFLHDPARDATDLVSAAHPSKVSITSARPLGRGPLSVTDDGRYVAFVRFDDATVFRDTNQLGDAFVADLESGAVRAATIDTNLYTNGTGLPPFYLPNDKGIVAAVISGDGSRVVVLSRVGYSQGTIVLCGPGGATTRLGNFSGNRPALSRTGNLLVYNTSYPIAAGDNNNLTDVYLTRLDLEGGPVNYLVSGTSSFTVVYAESINPVLSRDSRWIVFATRANILPGGTGTFAETQIVAADLGMDPSAPTFGYNPTKRLVSYDGAGQPLAAVTNAAVSGNSRYVVFAPTSMSAVYRHDLLASNTPNTVVATNGGNPAVNENGSVIAFERRRPDGIAEIVVADIGSGTEAIACPGLQGQPANGTSIDPVVSGDGRYVVFQSKASNLVPGDDNGFSDIFVRDRVLGATFLLSANAQGKSGAGPATGHVLAADGRTVIFRSFAGIGAGDFNEVCDVYVAKLGSSDSDGDGMDDDWEVTYFGILSRDGNSDFDGDGLSDRNEFLAGTDPTNTGSVLRVITLTAMGSGNRQIIWNGVSSKTYRVEYQDELGTSTWSILDTPVFWTGSTANAIDSAPATNRFYRVVKLP